MWGCHLIGMPIAPQGHPFLVSQLPAVGSDVAWPATDVTPTLSACLNNITVCSPAAYSSNTVAGSYHSSGLPPVVLSILEFGILVLKLQKCLSELCSLPFSTIHYHQDLSMLNKFIKVCCVATCLKLPTQ